MKIIPNCLVLDFTLLVADNRSFSLLVFMFANVISCNRACLCFPSIFVVFSNIFCLVQLTFDYSTAQFLNHSQSRIRIRKEF